MLVHVTPVVGRCLPPADSQTDIVAFVQIDARRSVYDHAAASTEHTDIQTQTYRHTQLETYTSVNLSISILYSGVSSEKVHWRRLANVQED